MNNCEICGKELSEIYALEWRICEECRKEKADIEKHEYESSVQKPLVTKCKPKKYYGVSFLILLICNFICMIPNFKHYTMGGLQGLIFLIFIVPIMLIVDLVLMFVLAAIFRKVMPKSWAGRFKGIVIGALMVFAIINIYRATLPLPYLQFMIDKIPDAVSYFEEHETELYEDVVNGNQRVSFHDADIPAGPMVNMLYIYVESPEKYPKETGKISRTEYIHPINEHWYLWLYQGYAA